MSPRAAVAGGLNRGARLQRLAGAGAVALLVAAAAIVPPGRPLPLDVCVFRRVTHLPCLTCGMTRAACAFARGDWARGVAWHPPAALLLGGLIVWAAWTGAEAAAGRALAARARRRFFVALVAAGAALALALWVARLTGRVAWPPGGG